MFSTRISLACSLAFLTAAPALAQTNWSQPFADSNRDGKVSPAEYQNSRRAYIMQADRDKNGKVDKAEWARYTKMVRAELELDGVEGADRIGSGGWFQAIDRNKDGVMTPVEVDAMTGPRFKQFDANSDGFIQRSEAERVRRMAMKER